MITIMAAFRYHQLTFRESVLLKQIDNYCTEKQADPTFIKL